MAVSKSKKKKVKIIVPFENIEKKLNMKQEMFCQYYARNDSLFGNATQSYAEAYGYHLENLSDEAVWSKPNKKGERKKIEDSPYDKACNVCHVMGSRLLRNTTINTRVKEILNEMMVEAEVDAELMHTLKQRTDYGAKMQAIKEFNKLKQRVTERIEVTEIPIDEKTKNKSNDVLSKFLNGRNRKAVAKQ